MNQFPVACAAPPLTDELLAEYKLLAADALPEVKDVMNLLLVCVEAWWELPESELPASASASVPGGGRLPSVPLSDELKAKLWDVTPWMRELNTLSTPQGDGLFDVLTGKLRDAAFHLLWYAKEITLDREPMSQDKIKN